MNEIERVARASLIDELALAIDQFLTHQIERDTLACDLTPSELTELATGVAAIAAMREGADAENQRLRAEVEALRGILEMADDAYWGMIQTELAASAVGVDLARQITSEGYGLNLKLAMKAVRALDPAKIVGEG